MADSDEDLALGDIHSSWRLGSTPPRDLPLSMLVDALVQQAEHESAHDDLLAPSAVFKNLKIALPAAWTTVADLKDACLEQVENVFIRTTGSSRRWTVGGGNCSCDASRGTLVTFL